MIKVKVSEKIITNLAKNQDTYNKGKELFFDTKFSEPKFADQHNYKYYKFDIQNEIVTIKADKANILKGYGCTCSVMEGACQHVVATLFYLKDINSDINKKLKTDFLIEELKNGIQKNLYKSNKFIEKFEEIDNSSLYPEFDFNEDIYMKIKISEKSTSYKYKVNDINKLLSNLDNSTVDNYGKGSLIKHNLNSFEDKSKKLYYLLKDEMAIIKDSYYIMTGKKNEQVYKFDQILMSKSLIDGVFKLYQEDLHFFSLEKPKIYYELDTVKLIFRNPNPEFFCYNGLEYGYVYMEGILYRTTKIYLAVLKTILSAFNKTKEIHLTKNNSEDFFSYILPTLIKEKLIDEDSVLDLYTPLKTTYNISFISEILVLNIKFTYGENSFYYGENLEMDFTRNILEEQEILNYISFLGFIKQGRDFLMENPDKIFYFLSKGIYNLNKTGEIFVSDNFRSKELKNSKISVSVKLVDNLLSLEMEDDTYTKEELEEALEKYSPNKNYLKLTSGKYFDYSLNNMENLRVLNVYNFDNNSLYKGFFFSDVLDSLGVSYTTNSDFEEFVNKVYMTKKNTVELTDKFENTLRNYQKEGVSFIHNLMSLGLGCLLADEMGLGKTIEVIGFLEIIEIDKPVLIVCPSSLIFNWKKEFENFSEKNRLELIIGTKVEREEKIRNIHNKIYITTYDLLKRDYLEYSDIYFKTIIIDEAQYIKNPETKAAYTVKSLKKDFGIAMTGTPIENSLVELWSISDFIVSGLFGPLNGFIKMYANPIMENDANQKELFRRQISFFMLRRLKKDVLKELPPKIETTVYAPMEEEQKLVYQSYYKEAKGEVFGEENVNNIVMIAKLTRLRQIACHPNLFINQYGGGSGKLNRTMEIIIESISNGNRVLLFSQFTKMLEIIKTELDKNNISYFYLDGKTPSKERESLCHKFNAGKKDVFLISLKAGGTGLNLTGANVVIHYDPWWNPSIMNQASDRAHRFGQKEIVEVFNIVSKDTIEEKIYDLIHKKKDLIDSVLNDEARQLTKKEILEIFSEVDYE